MQSREKTAPADTGVERACQKFLEQARVVLPLDSLAIVLLDSGKIVFSWRGASGCQHTHHRLESSLLSNEAIPRSSMNITLYGQEGPIGSVLLHTSTPGGFSRLDHRLASDLSEQLAVRLENVLLHRRVQDANREVALADQVAQIVASSSDLDQLFKRIVSAIRASVRSDRACLRWLDSNGHDIHVLESYGGPPQTELSVLTTSIFLGREVIGSLSLYRAEGHFSIYERRLMALACNLVSPAVQAARLCQYTGDQARQLWYENSSVNRQSQGDNVELDSTVDVAHALYSPLTTIKGYASSLLQPDIEWPPEVQREFFRTIEQAADRLNQAVRDLLEPTPADKPGMHCRRSVTTAQVLLDSVAAEVSSQDMATRVTFQCWQHLPLVLVDPHLIQQAIGYLIDCALAANRRETRVWVEVRSASGQPVVSVSFHEKGESGWRSRSSSFSEWEHDLRVVACRNILKAHETILQVGVSAEGTTRFQFALPIAATPG